MPPPFFFRLGEFICIYLIESELNLKKEAFFKTIFLSVIYMNSIIKFISYK